MTKNFVLFLSATTAFAVCGGVIGASVPGGESGVEEGVRPGAAVQGGAVVAGAAAPAQAAVALPEPGEEAPAARAVEPIAGAVDPRIKEFIKGHPGLGIDERLKGRITGTLQRLDRAADINLPIDSDLLSLLLRLNSSSYDRATLDTLCNAVAVVSAFIGDNSEKPKIMGNIIGKLSGTSVVGWNNLARLLTGEAREEYRASSMGQYFAEWIAALAKASDSSQLGKIANRFYEFVSNCVSERVEMTPSEMTECLKFMGAFEEYSPSKLLNLVKAMEACGSSPLATIRVLGANPAISEAELPGIFNAVNRSLECYGSLGVVDILLTIPGSLWGGLAAYLNEHKGSFKSMSVLDFKNYLRGKNIETQEELEQALDELIKPRRPASKSSLAK